MSGTSERMLELGEARYEQMKEDRINRHRSQLPEPGKIGPEECEECGNEIPMGRRQHGFDLCVGCASIREVRHGR